MISLEKLNQKNSLLYKLAYKLTACILPWIVGIWHQLWGLTADHKKCQLSVEIIHAPQTTTLWRENKLDDDFISSLTGTSSHTEAEPLDQESCISFTRWVYLKLYELCSLNHHSLSFSHQNGFTKYNLEIQKNIYNCQFLRSNLYWKIRLLQRY